MLDAFIDEVLRLIAPVVTIMVTTRCDTQVLGNHLPADTQVFLNLTGPSLNMPSVAVDEETRSQTSRTHKPPAKKENWDGDEPTEFKPGRWLVKAEGGKVRYDAAAGPFLGFSAGNRGCWGKRLAYLEMRILLALVVWELELEDAPEEYVSWERYDSLVTAPKECILRIKDTG